VWDDSNVKRIDWTVRNPGGYFPYVLDSLPIVCLDLIEMVPGLYSEKKVPMMHCCVKVALTQ